MKTPQQQAHEWAMKMYGDIAVDEDGLDYEGHCISTKVDEAEAAYIAGHAAGKQEERERILAILDHGCGQAPVQFTYAELRREIHEITEEDCYTGGEKV